MISQTKRPTTTKTAKINETIKTVAISPSLNEIMIINFVKANVKEVVFGQISVYYAAHNYGEISSCNFEEALPRLDYRG